MYLKGEGVAQDYAEAAKWFHKAADQGGADATILFNLGQMYYNGAGVIQNYAEAAKWFRKAADKGSAEAQFNLGVMYAQGEGVVRNNAEAVKLYLKAAEQGDADAQVNLGGVYFRGEGVTQDYIQSYMWFNLSSISLKDKKGEAVAALRDTVAKKMTPQQIAEAQRLTRRWKPSKPTKS